MCLFSVTHTHTRYQISSLAAEAHFSFVLKVFLHFMLFDAFYIACVYYIFSFRFESHCPLV